MTDSRPVKPQQRFVPLRYKVISGVTGQKMRLTYEVLMCQECVGSVKLFEMRIKIRVPREQNIKCCPCSTNVARGPNQKLFQIYAHAFTLSALSSGV